MQKKEGEKKLSFLSSQVKRKKLFMTMWPIMWLLKAFDKIFLLENGFRKSINP